LRKHRKVLYALIGIAEHKFLGGVPFKLLIDNPKTAVLNHPSGEKKLFHLVPRLCRNYGFELMTDGTAGSGQRSFWVWPVERACTSGFLPISPNNVDISRSDQVGSRPPVHVVFRHR